MAIESCDFDGFEFEAGFMEEDVWEDGASSWSVVKLEFWHLDSVDLLSLGDVAESYRC